MTMHAILTRSRRAAVVDPMPEEREKKLKRAHLDTIREMAAAAVEPADVMIRGMLLCSTERDYYYSKFSVDALDQVARRLAGRPVMVGHDYGELPIGRFITGERKFLEQGRKPREDSYWVEGLFYLPNDAEGQAIARRIDLGVYREVSLGWRCLGADCGICGNHIGDRMRCDHIPGEVYDEGLCDFTFSEITSVLEGSLVFAGGQKDTQLFNPGERVAAQLEPGVPLWSDQLRAWKRANENIRSQGLRAQVQSVHCNRDRFETRDEAERWVSDHEFRSSKLDVTDTGFRFRQFDMSDADARSVRAIRLDAGVTATICKKGDARTLTFEDLMQDEIESRS